MLGPATLPRGLQNTKRHPNQESEICFFLDHSWKTDKFAKAVGWRGLAPIYRL